MLNQLLEDLSRPRYFIGTFYLAFVGSLGANLIYESIFVGLFFGFYDYIRERNMKQENRCGSYLTLIKIMQELKH